jgi:hypothetical protein
MKKTAFTLLIAVVILLVCVTAVLAASGYLLSASVIAGGGGSLQAGSYTDRNHRPGGGRPAVARRQLCPAGRLL